MEFKYDGGGLAKGGDVTLYYDGEAVGKGGVEGTHDQSLTVDLTQFVTLSALRWNRALQAFAQALRFPQNVVTVSDR
jgi:hypothetical protein